MKTTHTPSLQPLIEVCANSVESALYAQQAGAYRVELCAGMPEGGTTPSWGEIRMARQLLTETKLHVIIRPRGGDFLYSPLEQEIMLHDIETVRSLGGDGIVIGCLTSEGDIDLCFLKKMVEAAQELNITFHRAFDMCRNPQEALEEIAKAGCQRILTSGQANTAEQGIPMLKELVAQAGERIIIMPGCGINAQNIRKIASETNAREFHLSGRSATPSNMRYRNTNVTMGGVVKVEEYSRDITDINKVKEAIKQLQS
ncbi:copper homeostasis protein CutC [Bacteroidaceae bacterium HV4-6-C5C]|nr:copper homeostasis protein CutC [Bacteroidaceae bacterium HV4-6-C5C]